MINKETIISVYNEKLTLLQWLKSVNKALDEAVLTNVEIEQRGNATFVFVFTFEDGTKVESNEIIVNQGESVNGASISNGHLYLTLTNGDELDAGNVKPVSSFSINENQHLIVHYGDGTSQDLGAIFSGNVDIDGNITANSIIEKMSGYSFVSTGINPNTSKEFIYTGIVKNGNKLTGVIAVNLTNTTGTQDVGIGIGRFYLPSDVMSKLYPTSIGLYNMLIVSKANLVSQHNQPMLEIGYYIEKQTTSIEFVCQKIDDLVQNTKYYLRIEFTFLLSDNLASE